jgi:hypothetical protein
MSRRLILAALTGVLTLGTAAPAFAYHHHWWTRDGRYERHQRREARRAAHRCARDPLCRDRAYYDRTRF